jgi:hypothetical protein
MNDPAREKIGFSCQGAEDGTVRLGFTDSGVPTAQMDMPADLIGQIAVHLMVAAKQASQMAGQKPSPTEMDASLHKQVALMPTGVRLTSAPHAPHCLVVEAGSAQLAIALPEKWLSTLGRALIAASASESLPQ